MEDQKIINIVPPDGIALAAYLFSWLILIGGAIGCIFILAEDIGIVFLIYFVTGTISGYLIFAGISKILEHLYYIRKISEGKAAIEGYEIKIKRD